MSTPRFAIVNTCDGPLRRNVCEWREGIGYCYMARSEHPHLKEFDRMKPGRPTSMEDFGFTAIALPDAVEFVRTGPSIATYEDGKPRDWQDRAWPDSFTLPVVKGPYKRRRVA